MDKIHTHNEIHDMHEGALRNMFNEAYTAMTHDKVNGKAVANATVEGAKMGSIWIPAIWGKAAAAGVYGADEVRRDTEPIQAIRDFAVGAAKGVVLQSIGQAALLQRFTPVASGIISGVGNRLTEMVASRETFDHVGKHGFNLQDASEAFSTHVLNPNTMSRDAMASLFATTTLGKTAIEIENHVHLSATIQNGLKSLLKGSVPEGEYFLPPTVNGKVEEGRTQEVERQRAARIGTLESVEQYVMGQSLQFERAGKLNLHRQFMDSVRQAKYVNSLPLNKAG